MTRRYFFPELPPDGGLLRLPEAETRHAVTVMRVQEGQWITLFDGQGRECEAIIDRAGRREVVCIAQRSRLVSRENARHLTLGIAMPKGDRAKELVERLTELGVNTLVPLHGKHSQWNTSDAAIEKWRRVVIESCKQSGRNQLMRIDPPVQISAWLSAPVRAGALRILAHPDGKRLQASELTSCPELEIAVGPEGGFSSGEVAAAAAGGWTMVSLGDRIYRIETAALVLAINATQS